MLQKVLVSHTYPHDHGFDTTELYRFVSFTPLKFVTETHW